MTRLESVATLISEKDFIGINIRSYQFLPDLDTLESVSIDFSDMVDEVEHMNPSKEYSKTVVYSFDKANVEHAMRISASILVSTSADLEDVSFVVSVEKQDGQAVIYRSVYPNQMPEEDGWYVVNDQFRMKEIQQDWVLKVYVWNPKGKEFNLDDLHVLVEN
jgi:hypothetical protein